MKFMRIESVRIENYKSYREPTEIKLSSGFNCIVGSNDVGKTAILEVIGLQFTDNPHRSLVSRPSRTAPKNMLSRAQIEFRLSRAELMEAILSSPHFELPIGSSTAAESRNGIIKSFADNVQDENTFLATYQSGQFIHAKLNEFQPETEAYMGTPVHWNGERFHSGGQYGSGNSEHLFFQVIGRYLKSRIFRFRAERLNAGRSTFGSETILKADASNLPEVLLTIQGNPFLRDKFNRYVRTIFSHVEHISLRPVVGETSVEILVWPYDIKGREDLALLLSESGTGISQALAILAVALASDHPQTIVIDEPQSFLHPGAARKLIEVLREYPDHQFVLATHSPTIIAAAEPNTITLIQKQGQESKLNPISKNARDELEYLLHEIGASLSDVFGADIILWVEGKTEELCFPLVARQLLKTPLMGTVILGVSSTGELEGRHAKLVFDIYRRLSGSAGLLPPAIGFILDREMRTMQEQQDLAKRSGAPVHFLSRRSFENYLVHPPAIAEVLSADLQDAISPANVSAWLEEHRWMPQWWKETPASSRTDESWLIEVDAPHLLAGMFKELSRQKVEYQKTRHSVEITRWLLQNDPEQLAEIQKLLEEVLRSRA
jgi:predicted ATPase